MVYARMMNIIMGIEYLSVGEFYSETCKNNGVEYGLIEKYIGGGRDEGEQAY